MFWLDDAVEDATTCDAFLFPRFLSLSLSMSLSVWLLLFWWWFPLLDYHDEQDENISGPVEQDQNHENARVAGATKTQHVAKARSGSQDNDHNSSKNSSKNYGRDRLPKRANENQGTEFKPANEKPGKQTSMTYRQALLGIDNSEPSSDF